MPLVKVKDFLIGEGQPLTVISGPCVIESEEHALAAAAFLAPLMRELKIQFIYKSSYDKANRSSFHSFNSAFTSSRSSLAVAPAAVVVLNSPIA